MTSRNPTGHDDLAGAGPGRPVFAGPPSGQTSATRMVGLALAIPALLVWMWSYLIPTVSTVAKSFQHHNLLSSPTGAGLANYRAIMSSGFAGRFGFAFLLALVPLIAALVIAPLLALAAHWSGRAARLVTRGLLAVPLACYAPTAFAVAWSASRLEPADRAGDTAAATTVAVVGWGSLGLVVAVAATLFLSALRGRRPVSALLVVGAVLVLGIVAAALQTFAAPLAVSGNAPAAGTPLTEVVRHGFQNFEFGRGAAASVLLLIALGLLGLAATGILLASRARIEFGGWRDRADVEGAGSPRPRPVAVVALVVLLAAGIGTVGYALSPWLGALTGGEPLPDQYSPSSVLVNTWAAPLMSSAVGVGLAALAGFGIGALRPLGDRSELLLLLFAPWLFVGVGPLAVVGYERSRNAELVDTAFGLIPPGWLCVPALFVFTLFFAGRHYRAAEEGDGSGGPFTSLVPFLPLAAAAGLLAWLVAAQGLLWPYLVGGEDYQSAHTLIITQNATYGAGDEPSAAIGLASPIPLLVFFALAFVAIQVLYLDRLTVQVGRVTGPRPLDHESGQPPPAGQR